MPATTSAPKSVCVYAAMAVLLPSTAQTSVITGRPSGMSSTPTGCCIHELATMMKYALIHEPITAIHSAARCRPLRIRPQPKIHTPRKVDSTKNASRPSSASGAPNTSPTKREYSLHAMPNWNSCTRPVATPTMKLMR